VGAEHLAEIGEGGLLNTATSRIVLKALLAAAALLTRSAASAQSYGDQSQVLTVGVSQFKGVAGAPSEVGADYYLYNQVEGSYYYFVAPLALPEGALVESVCLFGKDTDSEFLFYVQAYLFANKLVPLGESPATSEVPGSSAFSSGSAGYGSWCSESMSYTLRSRLDVDADGTVDDAVHYVGLFLPHSISGQLALGGVKITWKRQVSPAPSAPTFGDVPASHPFAPFIEALAASGITGGCGDGSNYCPNAPLTRGQMAVFLAKALGLHWVD
jgi:S-layer homology domain